MSRLHKEVFLTTVFVTILLGLIIGYCYAKNWWVATTVLFGIVLWVAFEHQKLQHCSEQELKKMFEKSL